jgi:hypothetical protein
MEERENEHSFVWTEAIGVSARTNEKQLHKGL